ncbi:MAG: PH domain-containing protein [Achromobacter pulmonis]|uniref:YokE-like PH domain-containing protein n=1 Tax=Achromobacter pulmonis TaxID=1389932 RepID=A0A6S7E0F9_9BURK|nr:PH domain-containing protein [Achromobacter pulmonis]MCF7767956.1 PH domain-containing protein [Achromobacter pulmonis]MPT28968.1 hypothetical protein [Achromobacter sp.]CAB3678035.1 hypothetical protein LMG26696_04241 [Achromobacter pulmonis]CAB3887790.1 hypothetical protein LMG26788_03625 [Achromobacter pulmonis]
MAFDYKNASPEQLKARYDEIAREIGDDQFFTKKELNHLPHVLYDDEEILAFTSGMMNNNTWLITLTDKRIIFLDKGLIYGLRQTAIDLDKVNAVSGETGLMFGNIAIQDSAGSYQIRNVWKKTVMRFANRVQEAIEARKARFMQQPAAKAAVPDDDIIAKLERLASLRDRGILTDAEFAEQKARILAA